MGMCKIPLLLIPLRESVVQSAGLSTNFGERYGVRLGLCAALSAIALILACSLQTLSKALGLLGCTSGVLVSFVIPGLMRISQLKRLQRVGAPADVLAGALASDNSS